jgi:hypothetical protein
MTYIILISFYDKYTINIIYSVSLATVLHFKISIGQE